MNKQDRSLTTKIDRKWLREAKRTFSTFPGLPHSFISGEEEGWMELMEFYRNDLKWLLSLEHHKFWSYMIYSDEAYELLVSYLKGSSPCHIRNKSLTQGNIKNMLADVEYLVFLVFLRLSMEKESEGSYVRNFGEIIYNNYLYTVPIILDICSIYGASNPELVKKMIISVVTSAPDFLDDFQEIFPHFIKGLKTVREKFSLKYGTLLESTRNFKGNEFQDLVLYLGDSVATLQIFLELCPNVCQLLSGSEIATEIVTEIVFFYSNPLPELVDYYTKEYKPLDEDSLIFNLIENIRIDMLKIVKSIFDFFLNETNYVLQKKGEKVSEYLVLMKKLLSEPSFLFDYNLMYSVEFEIRHAVENCDDVDMAEVESILKEVAKAICWKEDIAGNNFACEESDLGGPKLDSLVFEVKDIFPHLEESFIRRCLNHYNYNTEKLIADVLENIIPPGLNGSDQSEDNHEFKGKQKHKHKNLNEMLNDKEEINKMKEKYALLSFVADDTYDDEYDDTYDDSADISIREGDEMGRRPFVIPRILRTKEETKEEEEEEGEEEGEEGEEEEDEEDEEEKNNFSRVNFVENPSIIRERMERKKLEQNVRKAAGRGREHGQSGNTQKNREFKESHKSSMANHSRKKQAGKKYSRGMIPI